MRLMICCLSLLLLPNLGFAQFFLPPGVAQPAAPIARPAVAVAADDEKEEEEAKQEERTTVVPATKGEPGLIRLYLLDGSVLTGKLDLKELEVETQFGKLTVPIDSIRSFTPGLGSHPKLASEIEALIEDLGSADFGEREKAHQQLMKMGKIARKHLEKRADDTDLERRKRIAEILEQLSAFEEDLMFEEDSASSYGNEPLIERDTIVTSEFTIVGKIVPQTFSLSSPYGKMEVKISAVRKAQTDWGQPAEIRKSLTVDGGNIAQVKYRNTSIRLSKGDKVFIKADGTITMTPWGNNAIVTPDGSPNYGTFMGNIPGGCLVGRIGSNGDVFQIGSKHDFIAKQSGTLYLAIGVQANYANNQFPGKYEVRLLVKRANVE